VEKLFRAARKRACARGWSALLARQRHVGEALRAAQRAGHRRLERIFFRAWKVTHDDVLKSRVAKMLVHAQQVAKTARRSAEAAFEREKAALIERLDEERRAHVAKARAAHGFRAHVAKCAGKRARRRALREMFLAWRDESGGGDESAEAARVAEVTSVGAKEYEGGDSLTPLPSPSTSPRDRGDSSASLPPPPLMTPSASPRDRGDSAAEASSAVADADGSVQLDFAAAALPVSTSPRERRDSSASPLTPPLSPPLLCAAPPMAPEFLAVEEDASHYRLASLTPPATGSTGE
jgi:hypothetical protein